MKKLFTFLLVFTSMAFSTSIWAQDTLDVPNIMDGTPYGALNKFITNDSMRPSTRVYRLERGKLYFLSGGISADFDLRIVADGMPDADNRPPVILSGVGPNGEHANLLIDCFGDGYFENIYFENIYPDGAGRGVLGVRSRVEGSYIFNNCIFEGNNWFSFVTWDNIIKMEYRDCTFRNSTHPTNFFNGRGVGLRNEHHVDSVIIENCTFFNLNSYSFGADHSEIGFLSFSHNTVVNTAKWPIQALRQTNCNINDNIFYNAHAMGETQAEYKGDDVQDIDSLIFGIYNLFPLPTDWADSLGYSEAGRSISLHRNNWFYSQKITDYWAANNVESEPFMNSRTQGWFDDDANYPNLSEVATTNMDPGFINPGQDANYSTVDSMINAMHAWKRDTNLVANPFWGYEPETLDFNIEWPLPENLAYTNATLKTAAPGGCPIGDLNWWPDLKEGCMAVATNEPFTSKGLTVEQNMPNPFKGQTTIAYTLADAAKVNVTIIDINGKVITTLLNENQQQGRHTVDWNAGSLATGTYFYQIKTDHALITRKLELIK